MRTVPDRRSDDLALAQAAGEGDAQSCRELAERLLRRVRITVTYLAAGDRDADDLMQVSLIEILRVAGSYRGESSLERWADRIAVRTALRALKQRRRREQIVQLGDDDNGREARADASAGGGLEQELQQRQLRRRLALLLERLKPERRTVVVLHWVRGYTVSEIADLTDTPLNTVRDRLRVGKRQLRKHLMKDPVLRDWAAKNHESSA